MNKKAIGNKFGRLTIIDSAKKENDPKHKYWKCMCECGNECIKRSDLLNDKSCCGCMKGVKEDLHNKVFGRLKVIEFDHRNDNRTYWKCICECGNETIVRRDCLISGSTTSCGCFQKENSIKYGKIYGEIYKGNLQKNANYKHGDNGTRFYTIFLDMRRRCNDEKRSCYKNYGAKGIKCEWESYEDFKKDMYESYIKHVKEFGEKDTSIDRIDVYGNYSKDNCRWATQKEQCRNKKNTLYVILDDQTEIPLAQFCEDNNYSYSVMLSKYHRSAYNGEKKFPKDILF